MTIVCEILSVIIIPINIMSELCRLFVYRVFLRNCPLNDTDSYNHILMLLYTNVLSLMWLVFSRMILQKTSHIIIFIFKTTFLILFYILLHLNFHSLGIVPNLNVSFSLVIIRISHNISNGFK